MHRQQQQQHIELACPSRGSLNDGARLVQMCPSLYLAACRGRPEEVMALLLQQHGAGRAGRYQATGIIQHGQCDILEVTAERNTVLHVAAEQGHDELIRELYIRFREESLLSRRNSALDTPLHCAARAGHARAVAVLVQLAQDCGESILGCKNEAGDTALHLAARHGHGAAVEILVSVAAEPAAAELNNAGVSPLYLAVMSGSIQAVRAITTTCPDASSAGPSLQNALHAAVFQSSKMVDLLLEWRPALAGEVDSDGGTPLHFASSDGDRAIVRAILRAGPPGTVYKKDHQGGLSALHVAARMGHRRVVEDMLEAYPDAAELRGGDGGTFVHAAAREKRSSVVSLAIGNPMLRGLLDAQDRDGNTPLHLAVAAGAPAVAEALLRKGKVRADVLNNDGRTPFDLATGSTSFFTMASLVVTLTAFRAMLRPQRQDHAEPWSSREVGRWIEKMSDPLSVVSVLIATAAFAAGFNLPGGYGDDGKANLSGSLFFRSFLALDIVAAAASVAAVILLICGKGLRSAESCICFAAALLCMWVALISLLLGFYSALYSVTMKEAYCYRIIGIYVAVCLLPPFYFHIYRKWKVTWFLLFSPLLLKERSAVKRQFPLGASGLSLYVFLVTISLLGSLLFALQQFPNR